MRSKRTQVGAVVVGLACLVWGVGCEGCGDATVAELTSMAGDVQRDRAATVEQWVAAALRDEFAMGDGLRTGKDSTAALRVLPQTQLLVRPDSIVRFSVVPPESTERIRVEAGEVEIETAGVELDIETSEGVARLGERTRTRVRAAADRVYVDVEVGRVRVESTSGPSVFTQGERFTLQVGKVTREGSRSGEARLPPPGEVEPSSLAKSQGDALGEPAVAPVAKGPGAEWLLKANTPARFVLPAGETATVHDPSAPTTLGLHFDGCEGAASVEVWRKRGRAQGERERSAILRLPPGVFRYRVRCRAVSGKARAWSGRLVIRRDAGTQRLPRTAPEVRVEADGRKYTVRYQNRLPRVTFDWPRAPSSERYSLTLQSDLGKRSHASQRPHLTLPAATLPAGVYRFRFETPDGHRSPQSVVNIVFDNTARAASLVSPRPGKPLHEGALVVAGVALTGSRVRIQSQPATVAKNGRFKVTLPALPQERDLVVRVEHPRGGVHYYLRH
ncbi:MAG: FecR domain-containing protein [Myxococcales bacterium]|nr:FecR domain-containing protein [Myxococcales bacterium]